MDASRFDDLARMLTRSGARRGLLQALATLPLLGGLIGLFNPDDAEGKGRRKRRKKRHKHGKGRCKRKRKGKKTRKCKPKSRAKVCAGTCGIVKNRKTCKKKVDCGPCACNPSCPVCQVCDEAAGACVLDPTQRGEDCGQPGQVCQADGACRCEAGSCPACQNCQADGVCGAICEGAGCCDGSECQPGDSKAACGKDGEPCDVCSGVDTCQEGRCNCTPTTCEAEGKNCGPIQDGCGGTLDCGFCLNHTPICADNVCTPCSTMHPCPSGRCCGVLTGNCYAAGQVCHVTECQSGGVCDGSDCGVIFDLPNGIPCSTGRCCNGTCPPEPTCLTAVTCCETEEDCEARCCTHRAGHVTPDVCASGLNCPKSSFGHICGFDADCGNDGICICGTCCLPSGELCIDDDWCCSGACNSGRCA